MPNINLGSRHLNRDIEIEEDTSDEHVKAES